MKVTALLFLFGLVPSNSFATASGLQAERSEMNYQSTSLDIMTYDDRLEPGYLGYDYGPQRTVRWVSLGINKIPKILSATTVFELDGRLVNEVLVRTLDGRVSIRSVVAYLVDGRRIDLRNLTGSLRENRQVRSLVDRYSSLRISRIEIDATSPNLIGSRGRLQVFVGLAEY